MQSIGGKDFRLISSAHSYVDCRSSEEIMRGPITFRNLSYVSRFILLSIELGKRSLDHILNQAGQYGLIGALMFDDPDLNLELLDTKQVQYH